MAGLTSQWDFFFFHIHSLFFFFLSSVCSSDDICIWLRLGSFTLVHDFGDTATPTSK